MHSSLLYCMFKDFSFQDSFVMTILSALVISVYTYRNDIVVVHTCSLSLRYMPLKIFHSIFAVPHVRHMPSIDRGQRLARVY